MGGINILLVSMATNARALQEMPIAMIEGSFRCPERARFSSSADIRSQRISSFNGRHRQDFIYSRAAHSAVHRVCCWNSRAHVVRVVQLWARHSYNVQITLCRQLHGQTLCKGIPSEQTGT
ncbi:hypothetical protein IW261DRAFT_1513664 [Armillaria novae-zelandiae]|uniref:Uncharacterized protein n=1 Tax=Armillaria novae-zelandiae TaxID=153914 RepID=A0AA39NSL0_9AGAR|nr:hypothetical protein IW261DRAFT_1513664 [Armillaria novae-zelandiae]